MLGQTFLFILLSGITCHDVVLPKLALQELTTIDMYEENPMEDVSNVAGFGDAEYRGNLWYSFHESSDNAYNSDLDATEISTDSLSSSDETKESISKSSAASSKETKERRRATQVWRECTPCPIDKLRRYDNRGIKWICGGYHRARRTFKSECMMRYRNCQDGTMFTKVYDHRCKNDSYHGRHWFYVYRL